MSLSIPDGGIFATHVTWEDVEAELQLSLNTKATLGENKSIKQIGVGYGFMSRMCLVEPDWQGENTEKLPSPFLVKIPSYLTMTEVSSQTEGFGCFTEDERTIKQENNLRKMHNTEVVAFKIFERLNGGKISVPKVFRNVSYLQSMTPGLQEEETEVFTKSMYATVAPDIFTATMKSKYLSDLVLLENGYFADLVPETTQLFEEVLCMDEFVSLDNLNQTLGMDPVLTHCDLWAANLLWRKASKDEEYQVAAVIDFQSLKYENGALDLMRIMMQLRPEVRRTQWMNILETFYSYIKEDCKDKLPYTLEQLRHSFTRLFPMLGICTVLGIGHFLSHVRTTKNEQAVPALLQKTRCLFEDMFKHHRERKINESEYIL